MTAYTQDVHQWNPAAVKKVMIEDGVTELTD